MRTQGCHALCLVEGYTLLFYDVAAGHRLAVCIHRNISLLSELLSCSLTVASFHASDRDLGHRSG